MNPFIKETPFIIYRYYSDTRLFRFTYKTSTAKMGDEEFKSFIVEMIEEIKRYSPVFVLDDSRERLFIISSEMQVWTVAQLAAAWGKLEITKYGQILAKDFIADLSGKQVVEEAKSIPRTFESRFFENVPEALAWFESGVSVEA